MSGAGELEAIVARHASAETRSQLGDELRLSLARSGSASVHAIVAVGDLRLSGLLLREAVSPPMYARFVVGFTEAIRTLAGESRAWFDKFTGDGFVVFWLYPEDAQLPTAAVPEFCQSALPASETLVENLRRNSRNFPVGVGLALGLDSGPCELVRVGESLTVVGSPIVGATRMASGARAGETIVNVHLGGALQRDRARLEASGASLERTVVRTKEYPEGQEAYRLSFAWGHVGEPESAAGRSAGESGSLAA